MRNSLGGGWRSVGVVAVVVAGLVASATYGAAITPGNLVIYRVGDGSGALAGVATKVYLDEYTRTGTFVQSIPVSFSGSSAMTAVGTSTTEGIISLAQNGSRLVFTGYRKDAGGTDPADDAAATTNRVIGTLNLAGVVDTSIDVTDVNAAAANINIRSATTVDGSAYWISGVTQSTTGGGVRYVGSPGPDSTSTLVDLRNSRQVNLLNNTLFASNGSTAITGKVQHYGTLPTGSTAATPIVVLGSGDAVNGFAVLDLSSTVAGPDTIYALSTVASQLIKWSYDGSTWSQTGSISSVTAQNLTPFLDNGNVELYMTTAGALQKLVDTSGFGGTLTGSVSTLASAGTNTAFRGISVLPEPATLALLGFGGLLFWRRRRA